MNKIGITTTVPIEILLAAGYQPVDLNNAFITDPSLERTAKYNRLLRIEDELGKNASFAGAQAFSNLKL